MLCRVYLHIYVLVRKGLSIDDVGVSRESAFQEMRPGAGFETGDFVKEQLGGGYRSKTTASFFLYKNRDTLPPDTSGRLNEGNLDFVGKCIELLARGDEGDGPPGEGVSSWLNWRNRRREDIVVSVD